VVGGGAVLSDAEFGLGSGFLVLQGGCGGLILCVFPDRLWDVCCRDGGCELRCWNEPRFGLNAFGESFLMN